MLGGLADSVQGGRFGPAAVAPEEAARTAAAAGTGKGRDVPPLDGAVRTRLRRQALDWLTTETAAHAKELDSGRPPARDLVRTSLVGLKQRPDLAGVREPESLAKLPEVEQADWRALWADVNTLQKRVGTPPP